MVQTVNGVLRGEHEHHRTARGLGQPVSRLANVRFGQRQRMTAVHGHDLDACPRLTQGLDPVVAPDLTAHHQDSQTRRRHERRLLQ